MKTIAFPLLPIQLTSRTQDIIMRISCSLAGCILFAIAVSNMQAQTIILPLNPDPNLQSTQSANFIHEKFASGADAPRNPAMPDAFGAGTAPTAPNAIVQDDKPICGITHLVRCIQDLGEDDKGIFTSPLRVQPKDAYWLAPESVQSCGLG